MIDQQLRHNDCGVSAIKTVYNILGKDIQRDYIKEKVFLNELGSRLTDIKNFFDENQCETRLTLLDVNDIKGNSTLLKELFPFIVPVDNNKQLHFVVVNGIKGDKIKIYDSTNVQTYYLTLPELKKIAYFSDSYLDQVPMQERLSVLINDELSSYDIKTVDALKQNDVAVLFNKLTYFGYIKENYPFSTKELEKKFLIDLIYNQEISMLPEHFQALSYDAEKIKTRAPIILSIKLNDKEETVNQEQEDGNKENTYIKLLKSLKSHKKLWYIYIFTAIFAACVTQLAVFINQILIDKVLPSFQLNVLFLFIIGVGVFRLFNLVVSLYQRFIRIHLGNIFDKYFLGEFDQKLNDFSIAFIQTFRRGDLTERLSDSRELKSFFLTFFTRILVDIIVSIYSLIILLFIDWKLTMIVVVVMILFYIWFKVMTPILRTNEMKRFMIKANFFSTMIEKIEGIQVIKSFKIENTSSNKVTSSINNLIDIQTKVRYYSMFNSAVVTIITIVAGLLILGLLSKNAIENQSITLGQIITFLALTAKVFESLSGILNENLTLQENLVILKRYFDFNEKTDTTLNKVSAIKELDIESVTFSGISFEYLPGEPILEAINIDIAKGDKIKIEGRNGSGKSTFCKVLSMLYVPKDGDVLINELDYKLYDKEVLRKQMLLVSNEDILFNDSLLYNITFNKKVDINEVIDIAKKVDFYDFITSNTLGLNYVINENGRNLSTGQRKKILLMRALMSEAEIIILDEVLSGIDIESREIIEKNLSKTQRTIIVISHESTDFIKFNKQFLLNEGKLVKKD